MNELFLQGMIFARILPLAALAGLASAQLSSVLNIIDSFGESVGIIGPDIITKTAMQQDNDTTIGKDLDQLMTVLNTATSDLNGTTPASAKFRRQTADDESTSEALVLSDLTQALITINPTNVPSFPGRIPAIDMALSQEILAFGRAIGGDLSLVANISAETAHVWQNLTLTLSRQALGLTN